VLLRASRIGELTQLAELIQDAWLSRASARRAAAWLRAHPPTWSHLAILSAVRQSAHGQRAISGGSGCRRV